MKMYKAYLLTFSVVTSGKQKKEIIRLGLKDMTNTITIATKRNQCYVHVLVHQLVVMSQCIFHWESQLLFLEEKCCSVPLLL